MQISPTKALHDIVTHQIGNNPENTNNTNDVNVTGDEEGEDKEVEAINR